MRSLLVVLLVAASLLVAGKNSSDSTKLPKQPIRAKIVFSLDSNSVPTDRSAAVRVLTQRREDLRLQWMQQDAYLVGQIELLNSVRQDTVLFQSGQK